MSNVFFSVIFMTISFSFFFTSTSMGAVNRALLYLPIPLLQKSVNILEVDGYEDLYFIQNDLTKDLDAYFEKALTKYVVSYTATYIFTNEDNTNICIDNKCHGVRITIDAEIYFNSSYSKTMFYSIGGR